MAPPNALSMLKSEVSLLLTSMKCSSRSNYRLAQDDTKHPLLTSLKNLRKELNETSDLDSLSPLVYLTPFLDVIRSETTTGPITGLALTSVEKFLAYGFLELPPSSSLPHYHSGIPPQASIDSVGIAIETIAEAVIQARFIRSGTSSDEVVLMNIVHLLRTLLLVPTGSLLSNEMVYEILQNCFRICLETQLSELLRRTAEQFLASIVQLFFSRLPALIIADQQLQRSQPSVEEPRQRTESFTLNSLTEAPSTAMPVSLAQPAIPESEEGSSPTSAQPDEFEPNTLVGCDTEGKPTVCGLGENLVQNPKEDEKDEISDKAEIINDGVVDGVSKDNVELGQEVEEQPQVHVASLKSKDQDHGSQLVVVKRCCRPYTIRAVHNLFALLVELLNPEQHPEHIVKVALSLLTVALETGVDSLNRSPSILHLVTTDMTKFLMMLLTRDRVSLFANTVRVCYLLFESQRAHLKLQLEVYFQRLIAIISSDNERISYEQKEIALDSVVQLFLLPGLAAEIYVNYDCDPYCSNMFDDIIEMLTKNACPVNRLMGTHLLSLEALLAIIESIDMHCAGSITNSTTLSSTLHENEGTSGIRKPASFRPNRHWIDPSTIPSRDSLAFQKTKKKLLMVGSDRFNLKPKDGIAYLQKNELLSDPMDPIEMAAFLVENPRLDKRMIGEFLSSKKNSEILNAFVRHFKFGGTRIDEALRIYLESFRIPGEAPLIQHLMESFAEQWFQANEAPFANPDAAFTLSYAILMLNTDQHNPNSKKQNIPMTANDFKKNLKGMNGVGDFEAELIESIYHSIKNNEIVMPSEQTGAVRDNYLWKCLVRRSKQPSFSHFIHIPPGEFDVDMFVAIWGPTVAALSFIFDKTNDPSVQSKTMVGFVRCANIAAPYRMSDVFDNLVISLCKFTTLSPSDDIGDHTQLAIQFGQNRKAQLATRLVFMLLSTHADILREGWRSIVDCLIQMFRASLLPDVLVDSPDYLQPGGRINLFLRRRQHRKPGGLSGTASSGLQNSRVDSGMFSSFYQYFSLSPATTTSADADGLQETEQTYGSAPHSALSEPCLRGSGGEGMRSSLANSSAADLRRLIDEAGRPAHLNDSGASGGGSDGATSLLVQYDDAAAINQARATVAKCHIDLLVEETKFLMDNSLQEFIKALLFSLCGAKYELASSDDSSGTGASPSLINPISTTTGGVEPQSHSPQVAAPLQPLYFGAPSINEQSQVFCLELLIRVLLFNRDRVGLLWPLVRTHLVDILMVAKAPCFLVERVIIGLLRLALRLLRRQELTTQIFNCLYFILTTRGQYLLKPPPISRHRSARRQGRLASPHNSPNRESASAKSMEDDTQSSSVARQVVCGLAALLQENAAELPSSDDWQLLFALLEVCGAGALPINCHAADSSLQRGRHDNMYSSLQDVASGAAGHQREYASDNEYQESGAQNTKSTILAALQEQHQKERGGGMSSFCPEAWVLVNVEQQTSGVTTVRSNSLSGLEPDPNAALETSQSVKMEILQQEVEEDALLITASHLRLPLLFVFRDRFTLEKACDSIMFLVRDPAHITPNNIEFCVHALRVFIEAAASPAKSAMMLQPEEMNFDPATSAASIDSLARGMALQLLDLTYTLFSRAPSIYAEWTKSPDLEGDVSFTDIKATDEAEEAKSGVPLTKLWPVWLSLLQAMARLCVDARREVRSDALAFLHRALLSPAILHADLTGAHWEQCLLYVLFPLLTNLLEMTSFVERPLSPVGGKQPQQQHQQHRGGDGRSGGTGPSFFSNIFGGGGGGSDTASSDYSTLSGPANSSGGGNVGTITEYADPRIRTIPLLTKIFLQHLSQLYALDRFSSLWSRILGYMRKYLQANISDSLNDAVRESLKNLLLVMYTGTQDTPPILIRDAPMETREGRMWHQTKVALDDFLPTLLDQLFPAPPPPATPAPPVTPEAIQNSPPKQELDVPTSSTTEPYSSPISQAPVERSSTPVVPTSSYANSTSTPSTAQPYVPPPSMLGVVRIPIPLDTEEDVRKVYHPPP